MLAAAERRLAFALIQEPYVGGTGRVKNYGAAGIFQCAEREKGPVKAAIAVFDQTMDALICPEFTTTNIVVVKIRTSAWEIVVVSYYFEPDRPVDGYLDQLRDICNRVGSRHLLIGGDANARSLWWSQEIDRRGEEVSNWLDEAGLQVLNEGTTPTFFTVRGDRAYSSQVDVTACSVDLLDKIENWTVKEDITSSDHNTIIFNIRLEKATSIKINNTTRLYNTKKADWSEFGIKIKKSMIENKINGAEIGRIKSKQQLENTVGKYIELITKICKETLPEKKNNNKFNIPWWSDELECLKKRYDAKEKKNPVGGTCKERKSN
ncbi:hypothetical protein O3G_MSEX000394 [Manduca sexta]|nr:hypothetical protein O3G_MSEX000394 [Manduca sexta]